MLFYFISKFSIFDVLFIFILFSLFCYLSIRLISGLIINLIGDTCYDIMKALLQRILRILMVIEGLILNLKLIKYDQISNPLLIEDTAHS